MNRYLVSFWASGVFLGYVSLQADSKTEAEDKARLSYSYRGWDNEAEYTVTVEKK